MKKKMDSVLKVVTERFVEALETEIQEKFFATLWKGSVYGLEIPVMNFQNV